MRATDALAVRSLIQGNGPAAELTAPNWPKTPPESQGASPFELVKWSLIPRGGVVGIATTGSATVGLATARPRASGLVWDVEHLLTTRLPETSVELLRWTCERAVEAGARRLFLETAEEGGGYEAASRSGFDQCTRGSVYVLGQGFAVDRTEAVPARPRLRSDEAGLFQLYNAAVPAPVRAAEALDNREWSALYRGGKLWSPSLFGAQDYVWELGSRPVGWMHVVFGERAQYLTLLVHPQSDSLTERMMRDALGQVSAKAPVLIDAREYQTSLQDAVQELGFERAHDYVVWVRQLAQRVVEPAVAAVRAQPSSLA
ncbi:MAG: hypothetical protein EXR58_02245 [Chloroflexi bacterium]|nr:hypothetical protein [Chloroflexota bacterium]